MTEFKHKTITLLIILLPILSLIPDIKLLDTQISTNLIIKTIIFLYLLYFVIFKSNSKFKKYNKYLLLLGVFCLLYMKVNLNSIRLIYIKDYISYLLNFLFLPFALINFLCLYDDAGVNKDEIKQLAFINSVFFAIFSIFLKNYINTNLIELSLTYIILYYFLLDRFKPNLISFILFSIITYSFTKIGTINIFISFILLSLLNILQNKNKSSITLFLITTLFLIINYNGVNNYYTNYRVSIINILDLSIPIIILLTGLIYNYKNNKIKINMTMINMVTVLILLFVFSSKAPLVHNYYIFSIYYIHFIILLASEIKYLEKDGITPNKITLIAPLNFGVNKETDFVDLANYLGKKFKITVLFPFERDNPFKSENITILYLSDNSKFIKEKLRKFVLRDNSKVLISFDNETNKIINDYSLKEAVKIAFKQGDFISLAYSKFLTKRLKNIKIVVFTSQKALDVYKSILHDKKCYRGKELDTVLSKIIEKGE